MFHFKCTASKAYEILETENFFDVGVYLQPPKNDLNSDEDSDSEERTDRQHLSDGQLISQADIRIDLVYMLLTALKQNVMVQRMLTL